MQPDQIGALLTAAGIVIGSVAALVTAIGALIKAARKPGGDDPAPQVGIPATVPADDIDYRAYLDMKERAERAERTLNAYLEARRRDAPDEDTHPT